MNATDPKEPRQAKPQPQHYWWELLLPPTIAAAGIAVAFVGVFLTIRSDNQAERNREVAAVSAQRTSDVAAFQLAAAQIVMQQPTCKLAQARARELVTLFQDRLNTPAFRRLTEPLFGGSVCKELRDIGKWATLIAPSGKPYVDVAGTITFTPTNNPFSILKKKK